MPTQITKTVLRALREDMDAALKAVGEKHGLSLSCGSASFDANTATMKVEIASIDANGEVYNELAEDFKKYATMFSLRPDQLGKSFVSAGTSYKIIGLKPRNRKYPVIAVGPKGGRYKFPASAAQDAC